MMVIIYESSVCVCVCVKVIIMSVQTRKNKSMTVYNRMVSSGDEYFVLNTLSQK